MSPVLVKDTKITRNEELWIAAKEAACHFWDPAKDGAALMLGNSKQLTGNFTVGLLIFSCLCATAVGGLFIVKARWRTTWGALSGACI